MKKNAFTLSEILITLAIIGVIAAITIPALMNNSNGQEYRTAIKKAISGLNQAIALNFALEGLTAQDYTSSDDIVQNLFKKRMNNIKMPSDSEFTVDICDSSPDSMFTTTDGMIFCVTNYLSDFSDEKGSKCDFYNSTPCTKEDGANIWIDVNGVKKPNRVTTSSQRPRDIYQAQIYAQKVVPYGEPTQGISYDDENPDEDNPYYDQYDPNDWPSWLDFLKWLWNWLMGLIT
ncbi:MAG: type II secretion system protein [Candidatus Gastranaerophilales bacterium]|nr:type II secretion system protein [Candidatus Gastranaerophilales bacterium]